MRALWLGPLVCALLVISMITMPGDASAGAGEVTLGWESGSLDETPEGASLDYGKDYGWLTEYQGVSMYLSLGSPPYGYPYTGDYCMYMMFPPGWSTPHGEDSSQHYQITIVSDSISSLCITCRLVK